MLKSLLVIILFSLVIEVECQINEVSINVGIDTLYNKKNALSFNLWRNYLLSNPHVINDSPYWNKDEKLQWKSYDFLRSEGYWNPSLYGLELNNIVLSIEEYGDIQILNSMFYGFYESRFIPYAITKVLVKNNKLANYTPFYTSSWARKSTKYIDYIYYPKYIFSDEESLEANLYVEKICSLFDINLNHKITYFIAENCDELTKLKGFDYSIGMGRSPNKCAYFDSYNNIVYTYSLAGENHKHELTHLINTKYRDANYLLLSGLSVYNDSENSHLGKSFFYHLVKLSRFINNHPEVNFNTLNFDISLENSESTYFIGAMIVHLILKKGGIKLLKKALENLKSNKDLIEFIKTEYKIKDIDSLIKEEIKLSVNNKEKFEFLISFSVKNKKSG